MTRSVNPSTTASGWLLSWAKNRPEKTAYVFLNERGEEKQTVTYSQLENRVRELASHLATRTQAGHRVMLTYKPGLDFIEAFLACMWLGLVAVPVPPPVKNSDRSRVVNIVRDCEPHLILTTSDVKQSLVGVMESCSNVISSTCLIETDGLAGPSSNFLSEIVALSIDSKPEDIALIQYTSGSTGNPKGVCLSHDNLFHNQTLIYEAYQANEDVTAVSWLPQYHDMGLIGNILGSLFAGARCVLMSPMSFLKRPLIWLQAISKYRAAISGGPNFAYDLCVSKIRKEHLTSLDLSCWRTAYNGAEPIKADTLRRFIEVFESYGFNANAFLPVYGLAESTVFVSGYKANAPSFVSVDRESLAAGLPNFGDTGACVDLVVSGCPGDLDVRIVDPVTCKPCVENAIGEIWVKGRSVAQGYWNNEQESHRVFHGHVLDPEEGPFLRTGDLGFFHQGGLVVTGRLKEMIIVDGRNLYPQDIEQTLQSVHPALRANNTAVFTPTFDSQEIVAVQVLSPRPKLNSKQVKAIARQVFRDIQSQHSVSLSSLLFVNAAELEKTSSGKIRRAEMARRFSQGAIKCLHRYRPSDFYTSEEEKTEKSSSLISGQLQLEQELKNHIAQYLGIAPGDIDSSANFFDFGMDSKAVLNLLGQVEASLDLSIPIHTLYDHPTIAKLCGYLSGEVPFSSESPSKSVETMAQTHSDIAIIGMACRFPGGINDLEKYWELILLGKNAIVPTPESRWSQAQYYDADVNAPGKMVTQCGGYVDNVRKFDSDFFNINSKEALVLDPQQRFLLETSWHALEDSGIAPNRTKGKDVGVFVGISNFDYGRLCSLAGAIDNPYSGVGNAAAIAANRLSYFYDWRGPSLALDTACSSSLVALHEACKSLRSEECSTALAAAVNLVLSPELNVVFSKSGMMSPTGSCKTFSEDADGYVRGEGCGVLVLKRLDDARRDGDRIHAVIKSSAVTQDGHSNGLTAPSARAQVRCINKALAHARLEPNHIQYVEAHGTGTPLGDPIELNAIARSYGGNRTSPLSLGSVKANMGHLESAAGMAGVIKSVLALKHKTLPGQIGISKLTPHFDWENQPIEVNSKSRSWTLKPGEVRRAGVSSFGFGGTNAHVILEEPNSGLQNLSPVVTQSSATQTSSTHESASQLLLLSANNDYSLKEKCRQYSDFLAAGDTDIASLCLANNERDAHLKYRLAINCESPEQLISKLGKADAVKCLTSPKLVMMFTGQGSQYVGMGRGLFKRSLFFRQLIESCDHVLQNLGGDSIIPFMQAESSPERETKLARTDYTQPALFILEYALARLWLHIGVKPQCMLGHSLGELVAATVAGVFSMEQGLKLAYLRGKWMQQLPHKGGMAAVFTEPETIASYLQGHDQVGIAAVNGPGQVVLSGCEKQLKQIVQCLTASNIGARFLKVSHGFHSPLMVPILDDFRALLSGFTLNSPRIPIISNTTGKVAGEEIASVDYWCQHLIESVRFQDSIRDVLETGHNVFLEIGPTGTLCELVKQNTAAESTQIVASLNGSHPEGDLCRAIAALYEAGINISWKAYTEADSVPYLDLPLYPFYGKTYWIDSSAPSPSLSKRLSLSHQVDTSQGMLGDSQFAPNLRKDEFHFVSYPGQHPQLWRSGSHSSDKVYYHLGHFLKLSLELGQRLLRRELLRVTDLTLMEQRYFTAGEDHRLHTWVEQSENGELNARFYTTESVSVGPQSEWLLLASVKLNGSMSADVEAVGRDRPSPPDDSSLSHLQSFLQECRHKKLAYGTIHLDQLNHIQFDGETFSARIITDSEPHQQPGFHDAFPAISKLCLFGLGLFCEGDRGYPSINRGQEFCPYSLAAMESFGDLASGSELQITRADPRGAGPEEKQFDIVVFDKSSRVLARAHKLGMKVTDNPRSSLLEMLRQLDQAGRLELIRHMLAKNLAKGIGVEPTDIDLTQSFAELGIDSVSMVSTMARLKRKLNVDLSLGTIQASESINHFAETVAKQFQSTSFLGNGSNRFMRTTLHKQHKSCTVLSHLSRSTSEQYNGTLVVDETDTYFFDHPLDHIPGALLVAGAWELVCSSTYNCDPDNQRHSRTVKNCQVMFERFAEKDRKVDYVLYCHGGDSHSIDLVCDMMQDDHTIGQVRLTLNYEYDVAKGLLPRVRELGNIDQTLLHKKHQRNVLIATPERKGECWRCLPMGPPQDHHLAATTLAQAGLNPLYILEVARQFLTYLSHVEFGVELGSHVNLLDVQIHIESALDFTQAIELQFSGVEGRLVPDEICTATICWVQQGRTLASSEISAQVVRKDTYLKQRANYYKG